MVFYTGKKDFSGNGYKYKLVDEKGTDVISCDVLYTEKEVAITITEEAVQAINSDSKDLSGDVIMR